MSEIKLTEPLAAAAAALLEVRPLGRRVVSAHDGKSPIVMFDASTGDDRSAALSVSSAAERLTAAGVPVPDLHTLADELFFVRGEPRDVSAVPFLNTLHASGIEVAEETPERICGDLTPFIRTQVPQLTGRPLPKAAAEELQALLRGLVPALIGAKRVPTFGADPVVIAFDLNKNKPMTGLLPLCDLRRSAPERDGQPGDPAAAALFAFVRALNAGEPLPSVHPALRSLSLWYRRWVAES